MFRSNKKYVDSDFDPLHNMFTLMHTHTYIHKQHMYIYNIYIHTYIYMCYSEECNVTALHIHTYITVRQRIFLLEHVPGVSNIRPFCALFYFSFMARALFIICCSCVFKATLYFTQKNFSVLKSSRSYLFMVQNHFSLSNTTFSIHFMNQVINYHNFGNSFFNKGFL